MTLLELARKITGYANIRNFAIASAQATMALEARVEELATATNAVVLALDERLDALEDAPAPEPTPPPPVPPPPPTPPAGVLLFDGGFDTGDFSQWGFVHRHSAERYQVVKSRVAPNGATVLPRNGSHFGFLECRAGEPVSWDSGLCASITQGSQNAAWQLNKDVYTGWSVWVPDSFPWSNNSMHNMMFEYHANPPMQQAPFHFGILAAGANAGKWFIDLHRAVSGYSPVFQPAFDAFGPATANRWVDCVLRTYWRNDDSGRIQFWMDGALKWDWTGRTWNDDGSNVYPMLGLYTRNLAPNKLMFTDALKIGTTREIVDPASY